jgi:hypothetical protein
VAAFHLDQNVPPSCAPLLRQSGHTVVTAWALGMQHAEDPEHLLHAAQNSRILVTRDRDFVGLHIAWLLWPVAWQMSPPPEHAGIVLVPGSWSVPRAAQELHAFVVVGRALANTLYEYDSIQGWLRH